MHPHSEDRSSFEYPVRGLLQIKGMLKEEEIHQPTLLDKKGEECLIVIKNGNSTGVTIGRGSGIESFIREYSDYGIKSTSMEIAIYPYNHKSDTFSAPPVCMHFVTMLLIHHLMPALYSNSFTH